MLSTVVDLIRHKYWFLSYLAWIIPAPPCPYFSSGQLPLFCVRITYKKFSHNDDNDIVRSTFPRQVDSGGSESI